jgi:HlyD family secretion protein
VDVARPPQKKTGRNIAIAAGAVAAIVVFVVLARLKPAAPTVDMAVVIQDSVRRGDLVIEVRGPGTLVPEQIQQIVANATAQVDRMVVQSGQTVAAGDVLLEMSNPDVNLSALQADQTLNQARSALLQLRTSLSSGELNQMALLASTHTRYVNAVADAAAADTLLRLRMIAPFDATSKKALADEVINTYKFQQQQLDEMRKSDPEQIKAAEDNITQLQSIADFYHNKVKSLVVRAPAAGVVQGMTLQQGQYVTQGSVLMKVVQPGKLKAVLQIPESQAKDVALGQSASIDTRSNGLIAGHVSRKDPSAIGGTVTVDVSLDGALPSGAVPDLSVDGTVQIDKLHTVLYTGRPGYGLPTGPVGLFKIVENGHAAVRTKVVLGRFSVTAVEVVSGLGQNDKVILSDMSAYDGVDRVRLKQ